MKVHPMLYNSRWNYRLPFADFAALQAAQLIQRRRDAVNTLMTNFRVAGLLPLLTNVWPFWGGTQQSHAVNMVNASNPMVFTGVGVHSDLGYSTGGVNGVFASFNPSLVSILSLRTFSYGLQTTSSSNQFVKDILSPSEPAAPGVFTRYADNNAYSDLFEDSGITRISLSNAAGLFVAGSSGPVGGVRLIVGRTMSPNNPVASGPQAPTGGLWVLGQSNTNTYGLLVTGTEMSPSQLLEVERIATEYKAAMGR